MKQLIIAAALLTFATASAQTEVTTGIMQGKDYGVTYRLPKTQIKVTLEVVQSTYTPGEFAKYSERYLHLSNVSLQPGVNWKIKSIKIAPYGIPDESKTYFVKLKDKTVAPLMQLTDEGIVCSINMPYKAPATPKADTPQKDKPVRPDPRTFLTQEILTASSTAKRADLVAQEIYAIRESKNALLRGQADNMPKDGAQLKIMLDNLNIQEQVMTEMFSGTTTEEVKTYVLNVIPNRELSDFILFRFSKKLGVVANNDLAGAPYYLSIKDMQTVPSPQEDDKKKKKKEPEGIAYNVPGKAIVTLTDGHNKLYEGEMSVTQFGTIEYLAPVLFNKKSTTQVLFDPITGGLLKVDREEK